jgi:hypothetical protein
MNGKKAKWLKKLVSTRNPVLLLLIRNNFGEQTQSMTYTNLLSAAKKLYKMGEIQKVKNWPTMTDLKKHKPKVVVDGPLTIDEKGGFNGN